MHLLSNTQYAGKHLREIEKSLKGMDFGVIMTEGLKRTRRYIGTHIILLSIPTSRLCSLTGKCPHLNVHVQVSLI